MNKTNQLARVLSTGIVAVIRANRGEKLAEVGEALLAGGVEVMEVTFTVPGAIRVLEKVADKLGGRVLLGAGTVLDAETARAAMLAGAEFIVSPSTNLGVIEICRRYDKLVMPGAFTPTEVVTAWQAGADLIKIFPSDVHGPKYIKALRGPFPQILMLPTGGVNLDTAADFLRAGACALGVGSSLVESQAVENGDFQRIEFLARQFIQVVKQHRAAKKQATEPSPPTTS